MNNNKSKNALLQDLLVIFLLGLVPLLWFKGGIAVAGSDAVYPLYNPIKFYTARFFMWDSRFGAGMPSAIYATSLFYYLPQAICNFFGMSAIISQKILFIFWFLMIEVAIYYMVAVIQAKPNRLQRLIAVCFYAFNPLVFNIWEVGKAANISAYVGMPIILAFMIKGLRKDISYFKAAIYIGLFSLLVSEWGASPPIFAMPLLLIVSYAIFYIINRIFSKDAFKNICNVISFFALIILIFIGINAFWWLPYLREVVARLMASVNYGLGAFNLANWLKGISTHTSILNVSRFQGAWDWYYDARVNVPYVPYAKTYFTNPFLIIWSVLIPALAYSAIIIKKKFHEVFFVVMSIIATVLACGAHMPTGKFYLWMTENVPFFQVFRSPYYKFALIISLAYSYLISVTLIYLYTKIKNCCKRTILHQKYNLNSMIPTVFIIIILCCNFIYSYPMLNGQVIRIREPGTSFSVGIKVPNYIIDFVKFMDKQENDYRIIALPSLPLNGYRWGYVGPPHLLTLLSLKSILYGNSNATDTDKLKNTYYNALYERTTPLAANILNVLNVKYILVHNDAWYDFFGSKLSPDFLKSALSYQRKINLLGTYGKWQLYQNQDDPVYIGETSKLAMLVGKVSAFSPLSYINIMNDLPVILSSQKINHTFIKEELNGGIEKIFFYNANFSDFVFDFIEPEHKITLLSDDLQANNGHIFNFEASIENLYQVWIEQDIYNIYSRKLNVKIDGQIGQARKDLIQDDFSLKWINIANFYIKKGKRVIEIRLTNQEKSILGSKEINLIILPKAVFDTYNDLYRNLLLRCLREKGKGLTYFLSSEKMQSEVRSEDTQWNSEYNSPKLINVFKFKKNPEEAKWNWLISANGKTIIIDNRSSEEVITNVKFDVYSYEMDRYMYYYINDTYLSMCFLPKDMVRTTILKGIKLKPGDNYISFYSPDKESYKYGRSVTCAIKDVVIGNEYYKSDIYIPKSGDYNIRIYPYDSLVSENIQTKNKKVCLDEKEISFELKNLDGVNCYIYESIFFPEGLHSVGFAQANMGKCCLEVSSKDDTQEFSYPLKYKKINQTKYNVLRDSNKVSFLYFREAYNSEWEAYIINRNSGKKSKLDEHFIIDGYANGWKIDKSEYKKGSTIVINYKVQNLFYLGLSVSFITLIISISYLCYDRQRKGRYKK